MESRPDHFRVGVPVEAPISAIVDNRVAQLIEMGFRGEDAEKALEVRRAPGRTAEVLNFHMGGGGA